MYIIIQQCKQLLCTYVYSSNLLRGDRWSSGHAQSFKNIVDDLKEYVPQNKVIVHKVDQIVGVGNGLNDLVRF